MDETSDEAVGEFGDAVLEVLLEATELKLLKKDDPKGPLRGLVPILKAWPREKSKSAVQVELLTISWFASESYDSWLTRESA